MQNLGGQRKSGLGVASADGALRLFFSTAREAWPDPKGHAWVGSRSLSVQHEKGSVNATYCDDTFYARIPSFPFAALDIILHILYIPWRHAQNGNSP